MSETTYDDFLEKLVPDDLADDNFQTLFSTSPKAYVTYQKKKNLETQPDIPYYLFSSRHRQFTQLVCEEFNREDEIVEQCVVSAELHRQKGIHYHLAIKLNKQRRFKQMRQNLKRSYDIDLDFKQWHDNYYAAYTSCSVRYKVRQTLCNQRKSSSS